MNEQDTSKDTPGHTLLTREAFKRSQELLQVAINSIADAQNNLPAFEDARDVATALALTTEAAQAAFAAQNISELQMSLSRLSAVCILVVSSLEQGTVAFVTPPQDPDQPTQH